MVRATTAFCALGFAGCAQLFGLDSTSGPPDVALPPRATVTIRQLAFNANVTATTNATGTTAAYYVPDDVETSGLRRIPATLEGDVWTAELPDGVAASVEITVPDLAPRRYYAFPNRDLILQYGNYDQTAGPPPDPSNLNVQLTLPSGYVSGELFRLYTLGPWTYHDISALPAPDLGNTQIGPVDIPYTLSTFPSLVGTSTLEKITAADAVVALRYAGAVLTAAAEIAAFEQTGTDTIVATLVETTRAPLDVTVNPSAIAARLGMTTPAGGGASLNWSVHAAPGWQYANSAGPQLAAGSFDPASAEMTLTSPFGNPFTGRMWRSLFNFGSARARSYTPPALMLPITLHAGLNEHFEPAVGSAIEVPAGLPVLVLVNGTPLTSDGLTVTIDPNRAVTLGLVADRPGSSFYQFNIHELVPNDMPGTALVQKNVFAAIGPPGDITIPAGVFTTGKVYSIRAHCYRGGFPGLASGDFSQRDLPLSVGYLDSGVFTVAAP